MAWQGVHLGEIAELIMGQSPDGEHYNTTEDGKPLITGAGQFGERYPEPTQFSKIGAKVSKPGDIIICIRATIGDINWSDREYFLGRGVAAIRPSNKLNAGYLWHVLKTMKTNLESRATGSTFKQIKRDDLASVDVYLPSLSEQQRIADILDRAEALRAKRRASLAQLDSLAQAIFLDMFGDQVANSRGLDSTIVLGDVAEIVSGITKGRKLNGLKTCKVPYLAVINVQDRMLNLDVVKTIEATEDEIRRYRLQKDDLVLTEGGDPDKLGRGTLWNNELPECIHQNHIFRVRLKSKDLHPLFLNWLVGSERGKKYFLKSAKQTTGIASINMTQLRGFPLLVPPYSLQLEFARRIEAVEKLKTSQRISLAELDALFASLQHRAFRGEL